MERSQNFIQLPELHLYQVWKLWVHYRLQSFANLEWKFFCGSVFRSVSKHFEATRALADSNLFHDLEICQYSENVEEILRKKLTYT